MRRLAAALGLIFLAAFAAMAQDDSGGGDNGFLLNMIQNRLSAPGRQIRLEGVEGALSSQARIARVTVSDDKGPWFEIVNAELDWSRLALLRGRVDINRLHADRIAWLRKGEMPPAQPKLPEAEAKPFSLPELPVSINLRELDLPEVRFEQPVFGKGATIAATGALSLADGALDSTLGIRRTDGPGGTLDLKAAFANATRQLDIDVALAEPQGGLVATLLKIENEPAIDLRVAGSGPLSEVDVRFSLDADQTRLAGGTVALRARDEGLGFDADFEGELSPLIPRQFRDFFAGETTFRVAGINKTGGGLRIDTLDVAGAELKLSGNLETGGDSFLRNLTLTGSLGEPAGPPVTLPVPGAATRLHSATLHVSFGSASRWNGLVVLDRLETSDIAMEDVTLRLGGLARNLDDPAMRNVTVAAEGLATGLSSADPDIARTLGNRIDLFADAALNPGGSIDVRQLQLTANGLSIFSAGRLEDMVYEGRNAVRVSDLGIFSGIAGRELGGSVDLRARGSVTPLSGGFDLAFEGGATDLAIGDERVDRLAAGETTLSGRAVRDENGIRTEGLRLSNPQLAFASDGQISSRRTDIGFNASLTDLALLDPRLEGAMTARGSARGEGRPMSVELSAEIPRGKLMGRDLTAGRIGFNGSVDGADVRGELSGGGTLDALAMSLAAEIAQAGQERSLRGLELTVGPNRLTGDLAKSGSEPVVGAIALDAPDISPLAALALTEATGAISANVKLDRAAVGQGVMVDADAVNLVVGANRIDRASLDASVADALGLPLVDGSLDANGLAIGGVEIATLGARAEQIDPKKMQFSAEARLAIGTLADVSGELDRLDQGFAATLGTLRLRQKDVAANLARPSTITIKGGAIDLTPLELDFGTGSLKAQGSMDEDFDLDLAITTLPLSIANAIRPDLGLAGTVNGTARIGGPRNAPDVTFSVEATEVAAAATRNAGLPPIAVNASGRTAEGRLALDAGVRSANGLAATARGAVPLGAGALDVTVDLASFPLLLVDRIAGSQGLTGTVTGTAHATGPLADPVVAFDLRGERLSARVLVDNGVPPLALTARGNARTSALQLDTARVSGAGSLELTASGRIPFRGPGLDARIEGTIPLSVTDALLAERAAQATGTVRITAGARGSLAQPELSGNVSLAGGTLVDPGTNIRLEAITIDAGLEGNSVVLRNFRSQVATGGVISAQGRVGLGPGYPADLSARLDNVRYTDGAFVSTLVNSSLTLRGPLVGGGGMLAGTVDLGRTEISVAEGLGGSAQAILDQVDHVNVPPPVQATLDRAKADAARTTETRSAPGIGLDVRVNAPNQIFVRGRGLDVELGGSLRVRGTTTDIQPVGQFDLRRGRLLVLGQRIEFDEGSLQLIGNLDPQLNFVARTESEDVTAIVTVEGRASSPQISFSSEPQLPEDEVLSRILFNRATADLSAFQLAQLAAAAAELAGSGGPGILEQLRGATGLDDLDVITDESGATAVQAGKYLSQNVYLDVQTGTDGETRAEINFDVTESVTARGSVGSDGNTTIGLFFERDY